MTEKYVLHDEKITKMLKYVKYYYIIIYDKKVREVCTWKKGSQKMRLRG